MKRTDLQYRVIDDNNEQLVIEATTNGLIIQTSGPVELTETEIAQLRDQLTRILETETHP